MTRSPITLRLEVLRWLLAGLKDWLHARLRRGGARRSTAASLPPLRGRRSGNVREGVAAPVVGVRASHAPPQSDDELRPFREALAQLDPLLELRWNAQAIMLAPGSYSTTGTLIPPTYEGRWEVIRYATPSVRHDEKTWVLLCTVREYERTNGILYFKENGGFAPVDDRLLELLRSADAQNVRAFTELRKRLWAQHDAREQQEDMIDEGMAREGLDKVHFKGNYAGGVGNWLGRGADFGAMERASAAAARPAQPAALP